MKFNCVGFLIGYLSFLCHRQCTVPSDKDFYGIDTQTTTVIFYSPDFLMSISLKYLKIFLNMRKQWKLFSRKN